MKIERFEDIKAWQMARALMNLDYLSEECFQAIYDKSTEVKKLINAFVGYLHKS